MVRLNYKTADKDEVDKLAKDLNICSELATLLVQRGIKTFDEAFHFFRPNFQDLNDPFLFENMSKAVNLILANTTRKILIYGDYDVDGTTAVALVFDFLKKHLKVQHLSYYVPDRNKEGYGVSLKAVREAIANKVKLIITLDCGIKDFDAIKLAEENGIKVLVIDHHEEDPTRKHPASVVLDQKCQDCHYPFKELSGCGVAFKLVQALVKKLSIDVNVLFDYLDLVALSTTCDLVPIVGENRILVYYGLLKMKENPRLGIKMLIGDLNKFTKVDVDFLVFDIGPKINAPGRIDHASKSVALLLTDNPKEAKILVEQISFLNQMRRNMDRGMVQEALEILGNDKDKFCNLVFNPTWHPGLLGIVASKCVEKLYRPTIVFTEKDGMVIGSARSIENFNLYQALTKCTKFISSFGGHEFAAGVRIKKENFEDFKKEFNRVVAESLSEDDFVKTQAVDIKINLDQIDRKFLSILNQMEPFGNHFMKPVFETVVKIKNIKILKQEHVSLVVEQNGVSVRGIGFFLKDLFQEISRYSMVRLFYCVHIDNFDNTFSLHIKHVIPVSD